MTVKSDLQSALAAAQSALGTYAMFADSTEDPSVKQMFQQMQQDMQKHIDFINSRLNYLNRNSPLNAAQPQQQQQQ